MNLVEGYYKIQKSDSDSMKEEDLGIVKIRVMAKQNIKKLIAKEPKTFGQIEMPEEVNDPNALNDIYETLKEIRGDDNKEPSPEHYEEKYNQYDEKLQKFSEELSAEESEALIHRHLQNLEALETINKQFKESSITEDMAQTVKQEKPDIEKDSNFKTFPAKPIETQNERFLEKEELVSKDIKQNDLLPPEISIPRADTPQKQSVPEIEENTNLKKQVNSPEKENEFIIPEEKENPNSEAIAYETIKIPEDLQPKENPSPKFYQQTKSPEKEEEILDNKPKVEPMNKRKLLVTPHKKPPLPQGLAASIKKMSGNDLKEKELERITKIMRAGHVRKSNKSIDYSSDSDT